MDRSFTSLWIIWRQRGKQFPTPFVLFFSFLYQWCVIHPMFTFIQHVLLHDVILHLYCHLLWYWWQIGGLFPAGQVQRLCYCTAGGCLVLNVGLNKLRGGVWNGFVCGGGISTWTCVAHVGAGEHFNLVQLVGEVHITVNGCLWAKLSALFAVCMVSIVGYAVSWRESSTS